MNNQEWKSKILPEILETESIHDIRATLLQAIKENKFGEKHLKVLQERLSIVTGLI